MKATIKSARNQQAVVEITTDELDEMVTDYVRAKWGTNPATKDKPLPSPDEIAVEFNYDDHRERLDGCTVTIPLENEEEEDEVHLP